MCFIKEQNFNILFTFSMGLFMLGLFIFQGLTILWALYSV